MFPYHLTIDSPIRKHCKDNIEVCALALNLAKYTHLPAILHLTATHRASLADRSSDSRD